MGQAVSLLLREPLRLGQVQLGGQGQPYEAFVLHVIRKIPGHQSSHFQSRRDRQVLRKGQDLGQRERHHLHGSGVQRRTLRLQLPAEGDRLCQDRD